MGAFDAAIIKAQALIAAKGQVVTLRDAVPGTIPDATKPWKPGATASFSDQHPSAVFLDYAQAFIDGETIRTEDQRVLMPSLGLSTPPTVASLLLRGDTRLGTVTDVWRVIKVKPLNPNGQTIIYDIQVRK